MSPGGLIGGAPTVSIVPERFGGATGGGGGGMFFGMLSFGRTASVLRLPLFELLDLSANKVRE